MLLALAALGFVGAVAATIADRAWTAVFGWAAAAMLLAMAWRLPVKLDRQRANAQAAAHSAADQVGGSS
jgi:hypothetical protein